MSGTAIPMSQIRLTDPFWLDWQKAFLNVGFEHQWKQCEDTGRLENFRRAGRGETTGHQGYIYNDSDVYKLLEGACHALKAYPDWEGRAKVDEVVGLIAAAQMADGYIDTAFQLGQIENRYKGLAAKHELYCMGHLIEASVAHAEATGGDELRSVATKVANHVVERFGPGKSVGFPGHEEIELALCSLAGLEGQPGYRELAKWMVETRGTRPSPFEAEFSDPVGKVLNQGYVPLVFKNGAYDGAYFQDDKPLRDQFEAVGHAVRAMYLYCGAADASEDPAVWKAMSTIWSNLTRKRIYVTGGIGSAGRNEGFTIDYDLPNREAYAETCAAIGLVFWAARMSRATGDPDFGHWMERALYNAVLSGVNFDTDRYFYVNPLESRGDHLREPWYSCACCPPNIARLIMSVQKYAAHQSARGLTIDLPFSADYSLSSGQTVSVKSGYPWNGHVVVTVQGGSASVRLRIPDWARGTRCIVDGRSQGAPEEGYCELRIERSAEIEFGCQPEWLTCDARVADNVGKVALRRGPLVYCLEEVDLGSPVHTFQPDLSSALETSQSSDARSREGINVYGRRIVFNESTKLYGGETAVRHEPARARFVPYFSWANRSPGSMSVWQSPVR